MAQCIAIVGSTPGQCKNLAIEGSLYCAKHTKKDHKAALDNYRLRRFEREIGDLKASSGLKSLKDEIAILRYTLQSLLNKCESETDIILYQATIGDLIVKIEKLVTSCHKLDGSLGQTVDKAALLQFAGSVISIITAELKDNKSAIETIANEITKLLEPEQTE